MKGDPAVPGGSLTSKPTWSNTSGCSATSAFFVVLLLHDPPESAFSVTNTRRIAACQFGRKKSVLEIFMTSSVAFLVLVALKSAEW